MLTLTGEWFWYNISKIRCKEAFIQKWCVRANPILYPNEGSCYPLKKGMREILLAIFSLAYFTLHWWGVALKKATKMLTHVNFSFLLSLSGNGLHSPDLNWKRAQNAILPSVFGNKIWITVDEEFLQGAD